MRRRDADPGALGRPEAPGRPCPSRRFRRRGQPVEAVVVPGDQREAGPREAGGPPPPPPPAEDVYGFEDAPLPPRSARPATGDDPAPIARARPKKKSAGFFSSGPKKELYPGGPTGGGALQRIIVGIAVGIGGFLFKVALLPAIQQAADPTWASRGVIDSFARAQVAQIDAISSILRGVTDVPSAQAASGGANAALRKLGDLIRAHKDKKGKLTDIADIKAKYQAETSRAEGVLLSEVRRVAMIPDAWQTLGIQAVIDELAALDNSGATNMGGFVAPQFRPPPPMNPILPPSMPPANAGIGPAPGPRPGPGFGPRPGFGNRNRNRPPLGVPPG